MKYNLILITILFFSSLFSQSPSNGSDIFQVGYEYPNLRVWNLTQFKYGDIKMKEIRQSTLRIFFDTELNQIDSSEYLDYVVRFDSINNIKSVLFDFEIEENLNEILENTNKNVYRSVNAKELNPIDRLYKFQSLNDTVFYNYYENTYVYNDYGDLDKIKIIRPYRYGVVDGVYYMQYNTEDFQVKNYTVDDLLVKRETYKEEVLMHTTEYFYQTIQTRYKTFHLLEKIIEQVEGESGSRHVISIEYIFEK